jgi:hypothetical protein
MKGDGCMGRGHNDVQAIYVWHGMAWHRVTTTSGPLRTARTAARAAGRSDLSDHSTACSDSAHKARGTWRLHAGSVHGRENNVSTTVPHLACPLDCPTLPATRSTRRPALCPTWPVLWIARGAGRSGVLPLVAGEGRPALCPTWPGP